ncbi:tyrosine-type recombinase/integrase [Sutterella sp.]|uniref:tyrosine-type recombinase/integrase n=1 Tax=Sutterella sp. TaxID=1981025 RepID=UPI003FD7598F
MSNLVPIESPVEVVEPVTVATFGRLPSTSIRPPSGYEYVSTENAAALYLNTLGSKTSVSTVRSKLNQFARFFNYPGYDDCDWHLMRYENVLAFISHLKAMDPPIETTTINGYLCAIKGVAQSAWNLNQITDHDLMRIKAIKQLRVSRKIAGKALTQTESSVMLSKVDGDSSLEIRDRAILMLLLGCGLRRAEITGIQMQNVFLLESRIRLIGKGNKERDIFMNPTVQSNVEAWIHARRDLITQWNQKNRWKDGNAGNGDGGYLFGRFTRGYGYLVINRPMNPCTVASIVEKYRDQGQSTVAGLKEVTTHDLRRTFATRLLDKGVDIATVKNLMGHSNIATTTLYDRRGEDAMRKAANLVDI